MRNRLWLLIVVGKAVFMAALGEYALALGIAALSRISVTHGEETILGVTMAYLPTGIAAWWMFRKLHSYCTRREARAVAIAFAVLAPVSFGIAFVLSELSGGYAELLLGSRFALAGAFVGTVLVATLVNFALCLFTLRITRQIVKLESTN